MDTQGRKNAEFPPLPTPQQSQIQEIPPKTVDYSLYSQSDPTLLPFNPSNCFSIVALRSCFKMWNTVRILPSNSFLSLLFYQKQCFHDFIIAFPRRYLMQRNEGFQLDLVLCSSIMGCIPVKGKHFLPLSGSNRASNGWQMENHSRPLCIWGLKTPEVKIDEKTCFPGQIKSL